MKQGWIIGQDQNALIDETMDRADLYLSTVVLAVMSSVEKTLAFRGDPCVLDVMVHCTAEKLGSCRSTVLASF